MPEAKWCSAAENADKCKQLREQYKDMAIDMFEEGGASEGADKQPHSAEFVRRSTLQRHLPCVTLLSAVPYRAGSARFKRSASGAGPAKRAGCAVLSGGFLAYGASRRAGPRAAAKPRRPCKPGHPARASSPEDGVPNE